MGVGRRRPGGLRPGDGGTHHGLQEQVGARGAMVPRITRGGRKQEDTAPIIPGEDQTMSQGRGKGDFEFINGYESDS